MFYRCIILKSIKQNIIQDSLSVSIGSTKTGISALKLFIWDLMEHMFLESSSYEMNPNWTIT